MMGLSRRAILLALLASFTIALGANYGVIQAATPTISISPTGGPLGTAVFVSGFGFSANETGIIVTYDGNPIITGITASPLGSWGATFTVTSSSPGAHTVSAFGSITPAGSVQGVTFTLISPTITVSPTTGPPGTLVIVTGSGFGPNEASLTVTFDGSPVASGIAANSAGAWSGSFTVPNSAPGPHTISAYGPISLSGYVPGVSFTVPNRTLSLSPRSGPPGTLVTVIGSGFSSLETGINITYNGSTVSTGISANSLGNWTGTFAVPPSPSGPRTVGAFGSATPVGIVPGITFTVTPTIAISPSSGPVGTRVTVIGSGFGAGESSIIVAYDGRSVASLGAAGPIGNWSGTISVPASASGSHLVTASSPVTAGSLAPSTPFIVTPAITISPASGPPGTLVTVTGSGFGASEASIAITYDGNPMTSGISASSVGSYSGTLMVPASASGPHAVSAYGPISTAGSAPAVTFIVGPGLAISPASGPPGTRVTVNGFGFTTGETGVTITFDSRPVTSGISASALGNWSGAITIPASPFGSHTVSAYGPLTSSSSVGGTDFQVKPIVSVDPAFGYVGQTIQLSGSGFSASSAFTVNYDGNPLPVQSPVTDATGSFASTFVAPKSKGGNHTITATDGLGNSARATFVMDTTPPPAPSPLSPGDGSRIGIVGNVAPTFTWSPVSDPSGVTYNLQVASTPDFSRIAVEQDGITTNTYTLTAAQSLPRGQYYWRVKAVDGASNESPWSQVRLFEAGLLPLSALILIIAAGGAAIGWAGYIVMSQRQARRREAVAIGGIEAPRIASGQWRVLESGQPRQEGQTRALPWRLALPEPPKEAQTLSMEDRVRFKVVTDFAKTLPLVEPDYAVDWVVDLIETEMGTQVSTNVFQQLLNGELQVHYEPAWLRHPAYQDLLSLLEGQPIVQDLSNYLADIDRCAEEVISLLQQIYKEAELPPAFMERGGSRFIGAIYADAVSWFAGKALRAPSERDYAIKPLENSEHPERRWLVGEETTSFSGNIMLANNDEEAVELRALHLKLRRVWRNDDRPKRVAAMVTQLLLQRTRLLGIFSQLGKLQQ